MRISDWSSDVCSSDLVAVRQIFAHVLRATPAREETVSLWEPDRTSPGERGPRRCTIPTHLWLVGLGHLGQALVWGLLSLPLRDDRRIILQDDQRIGIENEATSLLVLGDDIERRKVRVAADWLDAAGWLTELIERRPRSEARRVGEECVSTCSSRWWQ